ncbi:hypothetical protein CSUI_003174, partial [Cystoisospora suis]
MRAWIRVVALACYLGAGLFSSQLMFLFVSGTRKELPQGTISRLLTPPSCFFSHPACFPSSPLSFLGDSRFLFTGHFACRLLGLFAISVRSTMDAEGESYRVRGHVSPRQGGVVFSRTTEASPAVPGISTSRFLSLPVAERSAVNESARGQDEGRAYAHRSPHGGLEVDLHEAKQGIFHGIAETGAGFLLTQGRGPGEGAPSVRSRAPGRRHPTRKQVRQRAAGRRRVLSLASISRVGALVLLAFYAHTCLNKGFSEFSSRLPSLHSKNRSPDKPSYLGGHGFSRRLAGMALPHEPSTPNDEEGGVEEALCGVVEQAARASRAAASQTVAKESDDEAERGLSTQQESDGDNHGAIEQVITESTPGTSPQKMARPPQGGALAVGDDVNLSAPPLAYPASRAGDRDSVQVPDGVAYLVFSNDATEGLSRDEFTQARVATAEEAPLWIKVLEEEEQKRLRSLGTSMNVFEAEVPPTWSQVNAILVAAIQGQITLLRMSRVFHERGGSKRLNLKRAALHTPTVALGRELRRCWGALGVTSSTVKALLRHAVVTIGTQTRPARVKLFLHLMPRVVRGIDPKAHEALANEGSVFAAAVEAWNPLKSVQQWVASGDLKLSFEDQRGALGSVIARDGRGHSPSGEFKAPRETARVAASDVDSPADQMPSAAPVPTAVLHDHDPPQMSAGFPHLVLSNEVAQGLSRHDYTRSRVATAEERASWTEVLEAEERERLTLLRSCVDAFEVEGTPTRSQVNDLLVLAIQGQVALMRMSRVFPEHALKRSLSLTHAAYHSPTMALACELRRCWRILGVKNSTLKIVLRHAIAAAGKRTWDIRENLFLGLVPNLRRGIDPKAREALAAEGK